MELGYDGWDIDGWDIMDEIWWMRYNGWDMINQMIEKTIMSGDVLKNRYTIKGRMSTLSKTYWKIRKEKSYNLSRSFQSQLRQEQCFLYSINDQSQEIFRSFVPCFLSGILWWLILIWYYPFPNMMLKKHDKLLSLSPHPRELLRTFTWLWFLYSARACGSAKAHYVHNPFFHLIRDSIPVPQTSIVALWR